MIYAVFTAASLKKKLLKYSSLNGSYVASISSASTVFKDQICRTPEYKCLDVEVYYVTYNCIGWAFGISKWLQPSKITNYIKYRNFTHEQAIQKFATEVSEEYPSNHISNIGNIANKLNVDVISDTSHAFNNTLSLYFDGDECLHGSRFLTDVKEQSLNQWTSKLGREILLSHNKEDLLYSGSPYGNTAYYIGLNDHIENDEL